MSVPSYKLWTEFCTYSISELTHTNIYFKMLYNFEVSIRSLLFSLCNYF